MTKEEMIDKLWEQSNHGTQREDIEAAYNAGAAAAREACAQPRPADPAAAEEEDDLYWRLHAMSKSLEGSGRLDEHENPDAYATVLDAMAFVQQHEAYVAAAKKLHGEFASF